MADVNLDIPMKDRNKKIAINGVKAAIKDDVAEFLAIRKLITFNSRHNLKWDFINTNVVHNLPTSDYQHVLIPRGSLWEVACLYEKESGYLYAFMRDKNFRSLSTRRRRVKPHYLDALAAINKDLSIDTNYRVGQQMQLFDTLSDEWNQGMQGILSEITEQLQQPLNRFVLISFDTHREDLISVNACMLTPNLGIAYKEDWSEFITLDFSAALAFGDGAQLDREDEIELSLREEIINDESDYLLGIKTEEDENEGDKDHKKGKK
ncbi:DUF5986 family protein [Tumebacillus permanentifrigoris]|uniref:Uncharacterized protein n=1 Tax=Tumebacillus permanentifrigoris TaxID=378543 RepID=A0A316DCG0_9BACL|nr:DUF5986 family protein [Tumebacillus permanentifrigoris]PWK15029.1 hypothetical protein C7459_104235 [Tumebacillus permanentifrigoris]